MSSDKIFDIPSTQIVGKPYGGHHTATDWFNWWWWYDDYCDCACEPPPIYNFTNGAASVEEAPQDGKLYARKDAAWMEVPPSGLADAPADAKTYGRKDATWIEVFGPVKMGEFNLASQTSPPPGNGQVRFNNSDQKLATTMWISSLTALDIDASVILLQTAPGDTIYMQDKDVAANYRTYHVNTVTDLISAQGMVALDVTWETGENVVPTQRVLIVRNP